MRLSRVGVPSGRAPRQRGVGLIEIMISIFVLSIGFLAAARMQVEGMRFSQNAYFRSQAYFLASDMADRMRANPQGVDEGRYDNLTTSAGASAPSCETKACGPAEIAQRDLFDWSAYLHPEALGIDATPALPSASDAPAVGRVTNAGNGRYTVSLTWSEIIDNQSSQQTLSVSFIGEDY